MIKWRPRYPRRRWKRKETVKDRWGSSFAIEQGRKLVRDRRKRERERERGRTVRERWSPYPEGGERNTGNQLAEERRHCATKYVYVESELFATFSFVLPVSFLLSLPASLDRRRDVDPRRLKSSSVSRSRGHPVAFARCPDTELMRVDHLRLSSRFFHLCLRRLSLLRPSWSEYYTIEEIFLFVANDVGCTMRKPL